MFFMFTNSPKSVVSLAELLDEFERFFKMWALLFAPIYCTFFSCVPKYREVVPEPRISASNDHHTYLINGPPVVQTLSGWVQGFEMKSIKGRPIHAFTGIPYAKPPIGDLRFRAPRPIDHWTGFHKADRAGPVCLQVDAGQLYMVTGQEDCLHLSIYTPQPVAVQEPAGPPKPLPVIFFLHGGGYFFGSSDSWGPSYLLDHDVILVTVNFRQGVMGFLSTGDQAAPGNYGLKDQALALQWVVDNIAKFGGDPTRITMMGVASGAAIANLNLISPLTRDHVQGLILHSGSAHMHWSLVNRTITSTHKVARLFKCPTYDSHQLVDCLRGKNPALVANALNRVFKVDHFPWVNFGPVVEHPSPEAYLTETPFDAYARNAVRQVPMLAGVTADEGDVFVHSLLKILWKPDTYGSVNKRWNYIAPYLFDYFETALQPQHVSTKIREFYLGPKTISHNSRHLISQAVGDRFIVQGAYKGLQIHSRIAPTYGYHFSFRGKRSITQTFKFKRSDWGVTHLDDLIYLLNSTLLYAPLTTHEPDFAISEYMTEAWANFAISGKPDTHSDTTPWLPISDPLDVHVLDINTHRQMIPFPYTDRMHFWTRLQLQFDYNVLPV